VCCEHGAPRPTCKVDGCDRRPMGRGGNCISHGGGQEIRCLEDGCIKRPMNKGLCSKHGGKQICSEASCRKTAYVGGLCHEHHPDYMCANCHVMWTRTRGGVCSGLACRGKARTKEYAMVDHIRTQFPEHVWIHNTTIESSCELYRPDLRVELEDRLICIECDEHQHISYKCDVPRMFNIWQMVGLPTIFIRWNPYNTSKNRTTRAKRLETLCEYIRHYLDMPVTDLEPLFVEYLHYDATIVETADNELSAQMEKLSI
jgi:hypothetical protein